MNPEIKEKMLAAIFYLDLRCDNCNGTSFAVADDNTMVCKNCKKRFIVALVPVKKVCKHENLSFIAGEIVCNTCHAIAPTPGI